MVHSFRLTLYYRAILAITNVRKGLISKYMDSTRANPHLRCFKDLLAALDDELAKASHEVAVAKICTWTAFERKDSESLRNFWVRFDRLQASLLKSGVC